MNILIGATALLAIAAAQSTGRVPDEPAYNTPLGSRIPRKLPQAYVTQRDAIRVMYDFSDCLGKSNSALTRSLLATKPDSLEEAAIIQKLVGRPSACLKNASRMRFNNVLFRGALAETFIKAQPSARPLIDGKAAQTAGDLQWTVASGDAENALSSVSECLVRTRPDMVFDLIYTSPATPSEAEQLEHASIQLGQCLPIGKKLSVNPLMFRASLAEAFYHQTRTSLSTAKQD